MNLSNKQIKSIKFTDSIFNFLLNKINDKNIEIDDFFKENNEITIFRISKILIDSNNDFKNSNIYKKSSIISNNFSNLVKENKINFFQLDSLNSLIEKHLFNEKLIFLDNEKRKSLEQNIQNKYKDVMLKKQKLIESLNYLKEISSNGDIKKINMVNSAIGYLDKSIKKFEQNFEEKKDSFNELFKRVEKFSKMTSLKGHLLFIDELKIRIDEEDGKLKFLETKLKELSKFLSIKTINEKNSELLVKYLSLFEDENELLIDFNKLKSYFKVIDDTFIIEKYLSFQLKKNKIKKAILGFIDLIRLFNLKKSDFLKKIEKLKININDLEKEENKIKEEILERNIKKIDRLIIDFENVGNDLNLKIIPNDIISFVVNKFQENNLLEFLFELTINDLRDITNSLAGSSLNINDIKNYQLIKTIIDELKEKSGFKEENDKENDEIKNKKNNNKTNQQLEDVEFIRTIIPLITDKLNGKTIKDFKDILKICSKNIPKLFVLFENKRGFDSSKEEIKSIMNSSIFEIYNDKDILTSIKIKYNCNYLKIKPVKKFLKNYFL